MKIIVPVGNNLCGKSVVCNYLYNEHGIKQLNIHIASYLIFNYIFGINYLKKFYLNKLISNNYNGLTENDFGKISSYFESILFYDKFRLSELLNNLKIINYEIVTDNSLIEFERLYNIAINFSKLKNYNMKFYHIETCIDIFSELILYIENENRIYLRNILISYFDKCYEFYNTFDLSIIIELNILYDRISSFLSDLIFRNDVLFWFKLIKPGILYAYENQFDISINNLDYLYEYNELLSIFKNISKKPIILYNDINLTGFKNKFNINYKYSSTKEKEIAGFKEISNYLIKNDYTDLFFENISSII